MVQSQVSAKLVPDRESLDERTHALSVHGLPMLLAVQGLVHRCYRRVIPRHRAERVGLNFYRGCAIAMPISLVLWALIFGIGYGIYIEFCHE
jgi:hypothetical protein